MLMNLIIDLKMENNVTKIYFIPGDIVILKHDLDNKPIMLVTEVVTSRFLTSPLNMNGYSDLTEKNHKNYFKGIRCGWFDADQVWRE